METLNDLLRTFPEHGERPAIVDLTGYRRFTWSFAGLHRRVLALSGLLQRRGIRSGDRVLLWGPNSPEWVAGFFACASFGATLVPADARSSAKLVAQFVQRAGVRLALRSRFTGEAELGVETLWLEDVRRQIDAAEQPLARVEEVDPEHLLEIVFTSGTTGEPKGVRLSHRNVAANLAAVRELIQLEPEHGFLSLLPLSHMFEQTVGLLGPLSYGAPVHYLRTLKPTSILTALTDDRVRVVACVPRLLQLFRGAIEGRLGSDPDAPFQRVLRLARRLPFAWRGRLFYPIHAKLGHPYFFISGGAPLDPDLERFWNALGVRVLVGYGLTETAPILTCNTLEERRFGSVGRALPGVDLRISADGEVLARGPNVFSGYLDDPEATAEAFAGEWFRTGDLGTIDDDGYLYLKGRGKDLIVLSDGSNVHADDVERVLRGASELRDACVLGMPADGGEKVHAVLLPEPEAERLGEVVRRVNEELEPAQQVADWTVWHEEDFPRTTTLKVRKHEVRATLQRTSEEERAQAGAALMAGKQDRLRLVLAQLSGRAPDDIAGEHRLQGDLGLGSLDRVELVARLEQALNTDLDESLFRADTRVEEIEELVASGGGGVERIRFRRWVRGGPVRAVRSWLQRRVFFPILARYYDVSVAGLEHLDGLDEPVVFAANHTSHLDTPALLRALPPEWRDRIAPAAWKEYFDPAEGSVWDRVGKQLLYDLCTIGFNAFLLPQEGGYRSALGHAGELLDSGASVLIYPEGERTPHGRLLEFKEGVGLFAKVMQAPVVPVWIDGLFEVMPRDASWPRPGGHVLVRFGEPRRYLDGSYAEIAHAVEESVRELAGAARRDGVSAG